MNIEDAFEYGRKLAEAEESKNMTKIEETLLNDLVDISISAQKVIASGKYGLEDLEEVILLREMTAHILNTYTVVKDD